MTLSVMIECSVYSALDVEVSIEVNVGAPFQGNISSLAADRWFPMYPS